MSTLAVKLDATATDVQVTAEALHVVLADGRELTVAARVVSSLAGGDAGTAAALALDRPGPGHSLAGCG